MVRLKKQMQHRADQNELLVTVNYVLPCKEFYLAVQKNKKMLESVRSSKKYPWKK